MSGAGRISLAREGASSFRLDLKGFRLIDNDIATAQSFTTFLDADSSTIVLNRVTAGVGVINVLSAPTMTVSAGDAKTLNLLGLSLIHI